MTDRTINIIALVVSAVGLIVTVITVFFTNYKIAALISLFVVEAVIIGVWFFYAKKKHNLIYPYQYESDFRMLRYVFETADQMLFECTDALRITNPSLPSKPIKLFWSGRGNVKLDTPLLTRKPTLSADQITGEINFTYPTLPARKFGDTTAVHFSVQLEDSAGQNKPELYTRITYPVQIVVLEVVLKYKDKSNPAAFGSRLLEGQPSDLLPYQKISDIAFDEKTKSYRIVIPNPTLGHIYQLKWER
jgi:hypothetical protein